MPPPAVPAPEPAAPLAVALPGAPAPTASPPKRRADARMPRKPRWSLKWLDQPEAVVIGLLGFLLAVAFSWVPSLWYDEAATVSGATRSWPQLVTMLHSVDAVHGLYYSLMHVWFDLLGYTPFTLRLPSAIATGLTAGLIVPLVRRMAPRSTAGIAGLMFCLLPRTTWMGAEGRSFALSSLCAVLLTLVFLIASQHAAVHGARSAWRWWLLYGVLAIAATTLFLYVSLLIVAHGVTTMCLFIAARRESRRNGTSRERGAGAVVRGWLVASVVAGLLLLPFVAEVVGQAGQVSWIAKIGATTLQDFVVVQWFLSNPSFAILGWALILGGLGVLVFRASVRRRGSIATAPRESPPEIAAAPGLPSVLALVLPWLVLPTLALIVLSLVLTPVYSPRYVSFAAPAAAILMAVAITALPRRWLRVTAVLACVALTAPGYVAQRLPEAKQKTSWNEVANLIAAERAREPVGTGEAIIYGPVRQHPSATTRVIAYSYPDAFAGLVDVKLATPAAETGQLWETRYPLAEVTDRLTGMDIVWLVTSNKQDWRPSVTAELSALGYSLDTEWNLTGVNVLRFEK